VKNLKFKTVGKCIWTIAVLFFAVSYVIKNKEIMFNATKTLNTWVILMSIFFILCAKIALIVNMKHANQKFSIPLTWRECYRIYNLTQLAKYAPGSIWHFIGRIAIFRERGISMVKIRNSLIAEQLWIISIAGIIGSIIIILTGKNDFLNYFIELDIKGMHIYFILYIFLGFCTIFMVSWFRKIGLRNLFDNFKCFLPSIDSILTLVVAWLLFAVALWVTILPFNIRMPDFSYILSTYCLSYLVGFIVPFAPAGIGVRDGILILSLVPFVGNEIAVLLSGLNRAIHILSELLLAIIALKMSKK